MGAPDCSIGVGAPYMKTTELLDAHEVRYEVLTGAIVIAPPADQLHQEIQLDILMQARRVGYPATMDASVSFPGGEDEFRPDVAVYDEHTVLPRAGNRPGERVLLAVEVVSPSSRLHDEVAKRELYARLGVPAYLVVQQTGDLWTLHHTPAGAGYTRLIEGPMGDFVPVPSLPWAVRTWTLDRYMNG